MPSPFYRAIGGPCRGKLEFGETVPAHLPEFGKGSGNPAPKLADRWKSGVWLAKRDLTYEHLVRTDDELYMREVYDDSQSTVGQKRTSSQSSRPHRSRGRRKLMMQLIPEQYQKYMNTRTRMKKRTTTMVRTRNHPTIQTTRIMTWKRRRFWSPTQLRRRARAEERSAQKHKITCS